MICCIHTRESATVERGTGKCSKSTVWTNYLSLLSQAILPPLSVSQFLNNNNIVYLLILRAANSLMGIGAKSSAQSPKKLSTTYVPKMSDMMETIEGFMMSVYVQANKKAGSSPKTPRGPKASFRYAYSPPDFGTSVPSSQ